VRYITARGTAGNYVENERWIVPGSKQHAARGETDGSELRYPWQELLREAVLEFGAELPEKVRRAEQAMRDRLQVLQFERHDFHEQQALLDGLATLEILKRKRR
jgi:hypothetical protein